MSGYTADYTADYTRHAPVDMEKMMDARMSDTDNSEPGLSPDNYVGTVEDYIRHSYEQFDNLMETIGMQMQAIDKMLAVNYDEAQRLQEKLARLNAKDDTLRANLQDMQRIREASVKVRETFNVALHANRPQESEMDKSPNETRPMDPALSNLARNISGSRFN